MYHIYAFGVILSIQPVILVKLLTDQEFLEKIFQEVLEEIFGELCNRGVSRRGGEYFVSMYNFYLLK